MQLREVIKKYRRQKGMTQEEMARRLGVTTPAVNKWESGSTMPDIMLLAPIARLLGISLDTLLCFHEALSDQEAQTLVGEAARRLETESYEDVFAWAKAQLEQYPNCEHLLQWMIALLDANRIIKNVEDAGKYDAYFCDAYERLLNSEEESVQTMAADSLYNYHLRKEQYDKAEEYLGYLSLQNPERKRKQAYLYEASGRPEQAYKAYEEILFSGYQILSMVFQSLYAMSMKRNNLEKARYYADKQKNFAALFEMGEYHAAAVELELVQAEQNREKTLECVRKMLESIHTLDAFRTSPLYGHMEFKQIQAGFYQKVKAEILCGFRDDEGFAYMREDPRWRALLDGACDAL